MPRRRPAATQGADGYWHLWVPVGTKPDGRQDRRHVSRTDKTAAEDDADELLDQTKTGVVVKAGRKPTVQSWLETWLTDVAPRRCKPNTIYHYRSILRVWVYPRVGQVRIDRLTADNIDGIYTAMQRAGRSAGYQLLAHRVLSRALKIAMRRRLVPLAVTDLIDPPTGEGQIITALTESAARRILKVAAGRRNGARWAVALAMGLRQGEAIGLRWEYVDLEHGIMRVWWQLQRQVYEHGCTDNEGERCAKKRGSDCPKRRPGAGLVFVPCKGKSKRTIAIPPPLLKQLKAHRKAQQKERLAWPGEWDDNDVVFARYGGGLIDPKVDSAEWKDILADAELPHARLHSARHTAATLLLAQGVDISVVQEILGHRDIRTTRGYAEVVDQLHKDAAKAIGDALFSPTRTGRKKINRAGNRALNTRE